MQLLIRLLKISITVSMYSKNFGLKHLFIIAKMFCYILCGSAYVNVFGGILKQALFKLKISTRTDLISKQSFSKLFWGVMPPDPPRKACFACD